MSDEDKNASMIEDSAVELETMELVEKDEEPGRIMLE